MDDRSQRADIPSLRHTHYAGGGRPGVTHYHKVGGGSHTHVDVELVDDLWRVVKVVQRQHTSHTGATALHCSTCRALSQFYTDHPEER